MQPINKPLPLFSCSRNVVAFALLFIWIILIFSNTFHASWQFDDYPNIVNNPNLHLTDLYPASLFQTLFSPVNDLWGETQSIARPVARLSFALNWYVHQDQVIGYHIVNLFAHFLTAVFLYSTIINLLATPKLNRQHIKNAQFAALLTTLLWAGHPIQTQAVNYIVQRMCILSAMFYVLGLLFYLKGRLQHNLFYQILYYIGCVTSYALALGSKENAVTLPAALLLIEFIFFKTRRPEKNRNHLFLFSGTAGAMIIVLATLLVLKGDLLSFLNGYENRPFTLTQRLMTEPGIIIFYLSLIFYPLAHRFSIEHDVDVSTSLFEPWTTIPSILFVLLLILIGFHQKNKRPVIVFSILFFFLNHIVESTIIPLELVFEHRNYLPSFFLFLPAAIYLKQLIDRYHTNNKLIALILVSAATVLIFGIGIATYTRNRVWLTEKSIWKDAMVKAPRSYRPLNNLATSYYYKFGNYDTALKLYHDALSLKSFHANQFKHIVLSNMGQIYYRQNKNKKALSVLDKALQIQPADSQTRFCLVLALAKIGRWDEALANTDLLLLTHKNHKDYLNMKGYILIRVNRPEKALVLHKQVLKQYPEDLNAWLYSSFALSLMGQYEQSEAFLQKANQLSKNNITTLLGLIENNITKGDQAGANLYLKRLFSLYSIEMIIDELTNSSEHAFIAPFSREILCPAIGEQIAKESNNLLKINGYRF